MIYNYLKNLSCILLVCVGLSSKAQTAYSETFGSGTTSTFPGGWTFASGDWGVDPDIANGGSIIDCTIPLSSIGSKMYGADGTSGLQQSVSAPFVTTNITNMILKWNGLRSLGAPALTVEVSTDNSTYTPLTITDVLSDGAWHTFTVAVPVAFENKSTVYVRWSYTGASSGNFIAFDDIDISGTASPVYYWDGSGALNSVSSWWSNSNATGSQPTDFVTPNQIFNLYPNATSATAATLGGAWTISGSGVKLNVGDGSTGFNLNLSSVLTVASSAKLNVLNTATLTLSNTTFPSSAFVTLNAGSTVDYAQSSSVAILNMTHSHLTISGGADKTQPGNLTINGDLNLNGSSFVMSNSSLQTLNLNGMILGSGTLKTGNSKLNINGSGTFGTITFAAGSTANTLNQFNVNRGSAGGIVLGSDLTVNSTSNLQNGTISLNGKNLTLNGAITFPATTANGSFIGSKTSTLTIGGSGSVTNNLLMSAPTMGYVLLNRSGATITAGNSIDIWGDLTPTAGTFAAGGNLTIKSDASNKGRIGIIGASGAFTGSPTVEVFKNAGLTGWVNIGSGGVNGASMSGWNSSFAITCASCPDGSSVGGVAFTSVYTYDETAFIGDDSNTAHYIPIASLGGLNSNTGYWVYLGNGAVNTTAITIPLTGGVNTNASGGGFNLTLSAGAPAATDGWNLISNPYPSPILVSQVIASAGGANVDNTFYVYDPDANANVPFTAGSVIPMGQAFSVRALNSSVNFSPNENWKTTTNNNTGILKTSSASNYYFDDFLLDLTSTTFTTGYFSQAYFKFDATSTTGFDNGKDAFYLSSSVDNTTPSIFSTTSGNKFLRNSLPSLSGLVTIPLTITTGTAYAGVYKINPVNINKLPAGACVNLYDIANNVTHNLRTGAYTATIAANATTPQFELRITLNSATMTSNVSQPLCSKINNGSIIAKGTSAGPWNYTWKDASDNIIKTKTNSLVADTLKNLGAGTFKVDVNTVAMCDNASQTFNVASTSALPISNFSVNKDTLYLGSTTQFIFTNNSTGANTYSWKFGDGNTANTPSATHMYGSTGDYKVSLIAVNSACGDSSSFNYDVHVVNTPTLAGITSIASSDNNIKIGKDAKGIFVQMNYDKNTQATVSISNVLGQLLVSPRIIEGDTEKFYFDVNAKDQLLLITVTTNDKRITQRIFNN